MTRARATRGRGKRPRALESDPLWYKDAIIYELHVRAFHDGDGDGGGDFRGLTAKLDYLQDLGITAIWLLPFYPSPLRDDGYDIADYTDVHRSYGTLKDVETFLEAAHARGLRVITELVINHTSDQHPWFQRARHAPAGSKWRDFYVWSDSPAKYGDTRIIFKDFEASNWTWDSVAQAYYWHRFYSHQPDLNFDNPAVHKALLQVLDFWLKLGVDGLRLDAIPYLYEREGTNCENLDETHGFLRTLRRHVDQHFEGRMLLAEANQWPQEAASYFGDGDECHMAFHFPVMPRLFMACQMEDRFPIIDILEQTPAIPETAQWAVFLRNHDELTLEMVTDEERDYMYRVYADDKQARINLGIRRRLAPLLGNHRRRIELMNGLLFSLPGTPVLYYGDEIGMGDNIYLGDRNGVRTPMQWSGDRNAGFSRANPQQLYLPLVLDYEYHPEAVNVEQQQNNPHSLLWWMKRLIALRKRYAAFGRGTIEFLLPDNRKVLAFLRQHGDQTILVVANLSRFVQYAELDLTAHHGMTPVELFGSTEFPPIDSTRPYFLTLAPHAFYWFALQPSRQLAAAPREALAEAPSLHIDGSWDAIFTGKTRAPFESALRHWVAGRRWFAGKARRLQSLHIEEAIPIRGTDWSAYLLLLEVAHVDGEDDLYLVTVGYATGTRALQLEEHTPASIIARLQVGEGEAGVLYDAVHDPAVCGGLLDTIRRRRRFKGRAGTLSGHPSRILKSLEGDGSDTRDAAPIKGEQSNTSMIFGDRLILKLIRRVAEGIHPDLEIGRFLTERARFPHVPPVAGSLTYERPKREPVTVGILQAFAPNEGDAWQYTLDTLDQYFEGVVTKRVALDPEALATAGPAALAAQEPPANVAERIGPFLTSARLLGQRTAELHVALASDTRDPEFSPEPFTTLYQRSLYQSWRTVAGQVLDLLRRRRRTLPEAARADADRVLELRRAIDTRFRRVLDRRLTAMRTRIHGDYHLGQVLYTGRDFVIIDFEGEPSRSLGERRLKRSPLRDVAGMLRSFHYAAYTALLDQGTASSGAVIRPEDRALLEPWADAWYRWSSAAFLRAYLDSAGHAPFVPRTPAELAILLDVYTLEKAIYEIGYELNSRPDWVVAPLRGVVQMFAEDAS